jgi:hypothetical protein
MSVQDREEPPQVLVEWWGPPTSSPEPGEWETTDGVSRWYANGHVLMLGRGRLRFTTAECFAKGKPDGWLLDTRTGCWVAWRGTGDPWRLRNGVVVFDNTTDVTDAEAAEESDDSEDTANVVSFYPHGLATSTGLRMGQLSFVAVQPRNLQRSIRRARQVGGRPLDDWLLGWRNPRPEEWPPTPRERHKVAENHRYPLAWDQTGHGSRTTRMFGFV